MPLVTIDIGANDPEDCGRQPDLAKLASCVRQIPAIATRLATILGAIGMLFVLRRRQRGTGQLELATACLLFFATAALILLASDFTEFSWRYQLPALITLPPAGVLGVSVLVAQFRGRRQGRSGTGRHTADEAAPRSPSEQSGAVG